MTILSAAHDFSAAQVRVTQTGGRTYLAVPMNMTMRAGEIHARSTSTTCMLREQGQWWLITLEEGPMMDVFPGVYPEFRGMDLPADTFENVE